MSEDMKFWLYHGPNMLIAIGLYMLLGRYILSLVFRQNSELVIWRVFCQITDPILHSVRAITPAIVPNGLVMVFAIFWMIILRIVWLLVSAIGGFLPSIGGI